MSAATEQSPLTRHAMITLSLCVLVAMFEGVDLQAAGVVAPKIAPLFHFAVSELKWFLAASTIGLVVGAIIGGRLADLWGRKAALMIAIGLFGLFSVATALAATKAHLIEARLLTGLGLGGALPNLMALTAEASHSSRRKGAVAVMYCGMPIGGGFASLVTLLGVTGTAWQPVFYVGGLAPLALLPLLWFMLPDSAEFHQARKDPMKPRVMDSLFGKGRAPRTIMLWVSFFCALLVLYLLLNWLPSLMVSRGLTKGEASWIQVGFNFAGAAGGLWTGSMMERAPRTAVAIAFSGALLGLGLVALVPATFAAELIAASIAGAAVVGSQSILYSLAPSFYPTLARGTGVGSAVSAGRLGSVAGPLVAGMALEGGGTAQSVLLYLIPVALVSLVSAAMLVRR